MEQDAPSEATLSRLVDSLFENLLFFNRPNTPGEVIKRLPKEQREQIKHLRARHFSRIKYPFEPDSKDRLDAWKKRV